MTHTMTHTFKWRMARDISSWQYAGCGTAAAQLQPLQPGGQGFTAGSAAACLHSAMLLRGQPAITWEAIQLVVHVHSCWQAAHAAQHIYNAAVLREGRVPHRASPACAAACGALRLLLLPLLAGSWAVRRPNAGRITCAAVLEARGVEWCDSVPAAAAAKPATGGRSSGSQCSANCARPALPAAAPGLGRPRQRMCGAKGAATGAAQSRARLPG